ncbi:hypothetical protein [Nitrosomonas oligotropha]|uniref:hypothetical protein n=1 Tax=Nitrosomonas oligotropha TaxID=42354 RepID=UPI00136BD4DB|nr:hypothetical protein [Nitrosomonas oligotropha]MXS83631.1 hypothetical protein [Nitrosomonas oligotropha]
MFQTIKNLYRKSVDAVMAVGRNIKSFFSPAIEGEYLGKGDIMRRSFNPRGSLAVALTFCFLMLPAISFAAVPADVTTAITGAATDIPCDVTLLDQTAFYWQLAGVLVAGFAVRVIIKAFQ